MDEDRVEASNLHRQFLFGPDDVGRPKVEAAAAALKASGAGIEVETLVEHLTPDRALAMLRGVDLVVEGSDNLGTKFLVADACRALGLGVVHGASVGWHGTVLPVSPTTGACYRCVFEDIPRGDDAVDCATAGVWGPVTSVIGALMAADTLRLLGGDLSLAGCIARYNGWTQGYRATAFPRRADCPLCGTGAPAVDLDPARYTLECHADEAP